MVLTRHSWMRYLHYKPFIQMISSRVRLQRCGRCISSVFLHAFVPAHYLRQGAARLPEYTMRISHAGSRQPAKVFLHLNVKFVRPNHLHFINDSNSFVQIPQIIPREGGADSHNCRAIKWHHEATAGRLATDHPRRGSEDEGWSYGLRCVLRYLSVSDIMLNGCRLRSSHRF